MSSFREAKIRSILESDAYFDDADRLRDIARVCGDDRIRDFARREVDRMRDHWTTPRDAARRIDDEQDRLDRNRYIGWWDGD